MVTAEPDLKGFKIPNSQEARDEKIRRLMAVLRNQYSGDIGQFYAAKARGVKSKDRVEIDWTAVTSALRKESAL